jgi:uncharacterized protein YdaL
VDIKQEKHIKVKERFYIDGGVSVKNRLGEINYNTYGNKMEIIEYISSNNITLKFDDGYILTNRDYTAFKKGNIRYPYDKSIYNIGYIGEGIYKPLINGIKTHEKHFLCWAKGCINEIHGYKDDLIE